MSQPTVTGRIRLLFLMAVALRTLDLDVAEAAPWQPQYAHPPEARQHYAHPPESQPQYAHPPESQPQYAHPPESQPQYAHPPESQPQYAHPPESQPQYAHPPESQPQYAHPPEPPSPPTTRRPMYRRTVPGLPAYLRASTRPRQLRQGGPEPQFGGPRHAFFKSFYPAPLPTAASPFAPSTTTTTSRPDVHVVAMSVSTSVKKGGDEESQADGADSPGSASVIRPVLVPPAGGPLRFRPEWEAPPPLSTTTQSLPQVYGMPEENYEVDEALSVLTNGRAHGRQPVTTPSTPAPETTAAQPVSEGVSEQPQQLSSAPSTAAPPPPPSNPPPPPAGSEQRQDGRQDGHQDGHQEGGSAKPSPSGYVVEGRNYRKYRVEEKTPDGFIVGEYGVVSHQDGSLRGVRYTADSTINPRLIYDALVKFLSL